MPTSTYKAEVGERETKMKSNLYWSLFNRRMGKRLTPYALIVCLGLVAYTYVLAIQFPSFVSPNIITLTITK